MVHNKSAVTKFWVSRLIKKNGFFFVRPFLQYHLNWNGENAVEALNEHASLAVTENVTQLVS